MKKRRRPGHSSVLVQESKGTPEREDRGDWTKISDQFRVTHPGDFATFEPSSNRGRKDRSVRRRVPGAKRHKLASDLAAEIAERRALEREFEL